MQGSWNPFFCHLRRIPRGDESVTCPGPRVSDQSYWPLGSFGSFRLNSFTSTQTSLMICPFACLVSLIKCKLASYHRTWDRTPSQAITLIKAQTTSPSANPDGTLTMTWRGLFLFLHPLTSGTVHTP